jgi:outer membrane protein assembly factor BamB
VIRIDFPDDLYMMNQNRRSGENAGRCGTGARWHAILACSGGVLGATVAMSGFTKAGDPAAYVAAGEWRQWGGPDRNFISEAAGLAASWPDAGPRVLWNRPLGLGHSSIVVDEGRLFTLYRPGEEISREGPWSPEEIVIAMDAATGETLWEYEYPSEPLNFTRGAGPHATPLVVGDRLFTAGTNKQIHAFDKATGRLIWSHDLVNDFGAPPTLIRPSVKAGYACSPIAYRDMIVLSAGGVGQAVMAFRQSDGSVVWKSGDFLVAEAAPILIDVDGQIQLVVVGGETINGLDPDTGEVLWSHDHDPGADMNNSTPIWGKDNILFVSSAYDAGSRALRLTWHGTGTRVQELWFSHRMRLMFSNAIRVGNHVYGTSGDFGPAFLVALDVRTGELAWQERGFGRSSLLHADGKTVILDEDGSLVLAELTPEGAQVLSKAQLFETTSWTAPALAGTTLYARDRRRMVALDLGGS